MVVKGGYGAVPELLIMTDALRRSSAARITAVIPYFGYARQDRRSKARTPITAKLVANMLVEAGVERILTLDLHATQIQGFFDIPVDNLYAAPVFALDVMNEFQGQMSDIMVVSPDVGGVARARAPRREALRRGPCWQGRRGTEGTRATHYRGDILGVLIRYYYLITFLYYILL